MVLQENLRTLSISTSSFNVYFQLQEREKHKETKRPNWHKHGLPADQWNVRAKVFCGEDHSDRLLTP